MFAETFDQQGCLVIDRLFDPALIDSVRREYEAQYSSFDPANLPPHMNVGDKRLHLPLRLRGPLLQAELYAHPLLMTILANILRTTFVIDNVNCVTALPGASDQKFHRDHPHLFAEQDGLAATLPVFAVTVAIPLIDLDQATGTTKLFAGSLSATGDEKNGPLSFDKEICPFVKRGGCFMMDYRLWHRGMANLSQRDRPILYIVYAREWFTDVINFQKHSRMVIDESDLRQIPIEHRQMFRRGAAKGLHDLSIKELMAAP
ncbi:MAG: phytanoyl-CoA dioxygenase family protein [Sphingomicrobium sp.]